MRVAFLSGGSPSSDRTERHAHLLRVAAQLRLMGHGTLIISASGDEDLRYVGGTRVRRACLLDDQSGQEAEDGLAALLDEEAPDLLHVLDPSALPSIFGKAETRKLPTVVSVTGTSPDRASGSSEWARGALESADAVVVRWRHLLARFSALGVDMRHWHHVPLGVDYSVTSRKPEWAGRDGLRVLAIPTSARDDDHQVIAEAIRLLGNQSTGITLYAERLEESGKEVSADAVAVPALLDEDSLVHALQAVASRIPLVVPDTDTHRELVEEHRCGFLFRRGDPQNLASLLGRLASEPGLIAKARRHMRHPPGIEEEAWRLERTYEMASSSRTNAGRTFTLGRLSRDSPGRARMLGGAIESPSHRELVPRAGIALSGWALCEPGPVHRASISVNDRPVGPARLGLATPHLLGEFFCPEAAVGGFDCWIDLSALPVEEASVRFDVALEAVDGSRFALPPVETRLEAPSRPENDALVRADHLQQRMRRHNRHERKTSPSEVRLVAFTHDLGYGGAQLYLFELLRRLSSEPWLSCTVVSPAEGPVGADLEALGIDVHITSEHPVRTIESYEGKQLELAAWVQQNDFNVVLANTLLSFPAVDLAGRLGIPSVWSIHESYESSAFWHFAYFTPTLVHPLVHQRAELALSSAAAIIFEADATRGMYERHGDRRRFATVPYGIELSKLDAYAASIDRMEVRSLLGLPESATVLLCLGIIEPRKGQTLLAQAFRAVAEVHSEALCVFVGDKGGSYAEALRHYLDRAGLVSRTKVIPVIADIYQWYLASDIFVCSSDLESLPRTVLEAMAFQLPVASTKVFGLGELLEDGRTGYLCEPRDVGALTRMLQRVLEAPASQRAAVAQAGARLVRERHDSSRYAAAYGRLFRVLAKDPDAFPSAAGL